MKTLFVRIALHFRALSLGAMLFSFGTASVEAAAPIDPSTLVTKGDVEKLLGQSVGITPAGRETQDEDTGGMLTYCTYHAGSMAVIVSVITFASPQEALAKMTSDRAAERMDGDATIVAERDLGARAFWGTSANSAEYVVVQGSHVLGIGLGGRLPQSPESYHAALRALATAALGKL